MPPFTYSYGIMTSGNDVSAESEENMKKNTADMIIEEDIGEMIDLLLNTENIRKAYCRRDRHKWINNVRDEFLRDGLRHLDEQMLSIIEDLVFEEMTLYEVSLHQGMDMDEVCEKIEESREILIRFV